VLCIFGQSSRLLPPKRRDLSRSSFFQVRKKTPAARVDRVASGLEGNDGSVHRDSTFEPWGRTISIQKTAGLRQEIGGEVMVWASRSVAHPCTWGICRSLASSRSRAAAIPDHIVTHPGCRVRRLAPGPTSTLPSRGCLPWRSSLIDPAITPRASCSIRACRCLPGLCVCRRDPCVFTTNPPAVVCVDSPPRPDGPAA